MTPSTNRSTRRVRKVLTTRRGGCSAPPYDSFNLGMHVGDDPDAVLENRHRLARGLGLHPSRLVWMDQTHSTHLAVVGKPQSAPVPDTDAIITTCPDLALVVLVADCVPVLLSDEDAGVIAAVHAGRQGARNGIVAATVERMVRLGADVSRIHALLGAAASGHWYEVPEEMAADVEKHLPGSRTTTAAGTPGLDIRAGLVHQLYDLGVTKVDSEPRCTIAEQDYFSHRRDGVTGRQAGVVVLQTQR
ncbi:peptidoglycan editing factor PgeF [Corynebacterium sp. TAE3-ERU12]|uniref:peptidoglycan editing factor PgeF n=1 Tax=Corynebacterium sp. TAE3-ERU12 TaxID=2849491 RepID=UPI00351D0E65